MKKIVAIFSFILIAVCFSVGFQGCVLSSSSEIADSKINMNSRQIFLENVESYEELVSQVKPAVVGISANFGNMESVGSGVCVAENGYILTNDHVVGGASKITTYFANKTTATAKLIWTDTAMDLAIIKVEVQIPFIQIGDSSNLLAGQDVLAIGTPLTLQFKHTTTKGIVSATDRTVEIKNEDGTTSYLQNLIQHDASINPGNSGGPLINSYGQLIGVNTLKVTEAEGLGFAIPIEVAVPVIEKISEKGSYQTPYIGMFGFDATIAKFYGQTLQTNGVYIKNVDTNGPMASSGIQNGDIIVAIDDYQIDTMLDLRSNIYYYNVGDTAEIHFMRNGIKKSALVVLGNRP